MPVPAHSIRSRPARGGPPSARISRDPDILASHLEDASHFPGGHGGVTLVDLDAALAPAGRYYPPTPTFTGAFVGGTVATNAAGAATFKYGTTREWVLALTVVLPNGEVLDIERGRTRAGADGAFDIVLSDRTVIVPVPRYR